MQETPTTPTEGTPSSEAAPASLLSSTETVVTPQQQSETVKETPAAGESTTANESTTAEETTKTEGAPESYDFKAPEGQTYDPAVLDSFSKAAKGANLSQDAAQKLLTDMAPALAARQAEQIKAVQNGWREASQTDQEFGGDKLQENLGIAKKALDQFAPQGADGSVNAFRKLLDDSGLGNNPEVIRFLYRVGKGMSEDGFVKGAPSGTQRSMPDLLYDKTGDK